jgi:Flp pilus assembly protein TadB
MTLGETGLRRLWRLCGAVILVGVLLLVTGFPLLVGIGVVTLGVVGTVMVRRVAVSLGVTLAVTDAGDGDAGGGDGGGGGK